MPGTDGGTTPGPAPPPSSGVLAALGRVRGWLVLAPVVLPWTVVSWATGSYLVFAGWWVDLGPVHVVTLATFLEGTAAGLPRYWLLWPVATVLYLGALASAGLSLVGREDRRVTAGLLVLAGLDVGWFAYGLTTHQRTITAWPLAVLWLWGAAALQYPSALRVLAPVRSG